MKREASLKVMCVAALLAFSTVSVWAASIAGSPHDLAGSGDYNEICPYCHTPRSPKQARGGSWGKPAQLEGYLVYSGYSGEEAEPAGDESSRSSRICLSCHDGSVARDVTVKTPEYPDVRKSLLEPKASLATLRASSTSSTYTGHPVQVVYPHTDDLVPPPPDGTFPNGVQLIDGKVECMSCHNPHDPTNRPFLVTDNSQSSLCSTCHIK
ncbi:MAG: cytochrome c3 family protein [Bacillota bacterium]|nr:cytochrome c3 family protein [Bacillota bacterium]